MADIERVERMARLLATAEYGPTAFDEFNDEERSLALGEAEQSLRFVLGDDHEGAVDALEQIALLLEAIPHGALTDNERGCLERAQELALPYTAGGR